MHGELRSLWSLGGAPLETTKSFLRASPRSSGSSVVPRLPVTMMPGRLASVLLMLTMACKAAEPAINLETWRVVTLGDRIAPVGAGGNYLTMYFGPGTGRVSGFAGCNQYNGTYTLAGDSIAIGPVVSTKMACTDGMELESRFLATLPKVTHWQVTDSTLTLDGVGGVAVRLITSQH
jgi:heat shock protein HslJ